MMFKKNKKTNPTPYWFEVIKEDIKAAQAIGQHNCYGYAPVGQEKLLMSLPSSVSFRLEMKIETDDGAEYYYKFYF